MRQTGLLLWLVVGVWGCGTAPVERNTGAQGDLSAEHGGNVVGFTSSGAMVVFDGQTGEVKSLAQGGGGRPRDVAVDPWRTGVWVFEENEDASGGEIRFCGLEKVFGEGNRDAETVLRPCEHAVWVDGLAALLPTRAGLWVFEDGIGGARWKMLQAGKVNASASAPRPASIWVEGERIEALSYGFEGNRLLKYAATFEHNAPEVLAEFDWGASEGYPPTARYARSSHDAGLLFDAVNHALTVRRVSDGQMGAPAVVDVGGGLTRLEAAEVVGESALVLATESLWIVTLDGGIVEAMTSVWLDGEVRSSQMFFSRDMLVMPTHAFVATDRGVRAVVLEKDGDAVLHGRIDEQFVGAGLRGPLDVIRGGSL